MKSDNVAVYRLKEDWEPFDKGTEFIDNNDDAYTLKENANVTAEIPADLLEVIGNKRWKPDRNDVYYRLHSDGNIGSAMFYPGCDSDEGAHALGNCFKTRAEALSMARWLYARQRLIDSGAEFINGVGVDDENIAYYGVAFDKVRGELHTIKCYSVGSDIFDKRLYFLNEDIAEKSIKEHEDDWLTYLGVKEGDDGNS